ncbi:MAG: 2,3-bisphosphoglycerate-independent phosphoglycerate mutase [Bacteroidetes bacterium]|nr:2,3-bisphosphoglycerate-independent phosphoglycerate mutase [Bacteroidota bacterium]
MENNKKVFLMILDGWGEAPAVNSNAIAHSHAPFISECMRKFPHAQLLTHGENVGLPDGQMGNSEVGHMNIGAGRIVYQDLARLNKEVRENTMQHNVALNELFEYSLNQDKPLHLLGLISDGGVHSHINHLLHLVKLASQAGVSRIIIHAITDGRDTDPKSGLTYILNLRDYIKEHALSNVYIGTVCGRYYAMDRDKRWERVQQAYNLFIKGKGVKFENAEEAIRQSYLQGVTDEFIKPCVITQPVPVTISDGDAVMCFNFRTDRCREITYVLTQEAFHEYDMHPLQLHYATMTRYDDTFKNIHVLYEKSDVNLPIGEVLALNNKSQLRIAETEKYPHVTFFFNGGREQTFAGEERIMVPSPKVATYDMQPEMSAREITAKVILFMKEQSPDFVCLNFANPDMVGHTGVYEAVQKAIETVDDCAAQIVKTGLECGYSFIIIADHGNADYMINDDGTPNTAHSTNPVPCIIINKNCKHVNNGQLADVAPTILKLIGIEQPPVMTGKSLV